MLFENGDSVTHLAEVQGGGQTCGSRANDGDLTAIFNDRGLLVLGCRQRRWHQSARNRFTYAMAIGSSRLPRLHACSQGVRKSARRCRERIIRCG